MNDVILTFEPHESVRLDLDCIETLVSSLSREAADEVVARAVDDVAMRLSDCEQHFAAGDTAGLRKAVRPLGGIAEQIGMSMLARVARDLLLTLDRGDAVAVAAVLSRLSRVGDRSLVAIWDRQGAML